jgi:acetyl esterase/lipase
MSNLPTGLLPLWDGPAPGALGAGDADIPALTPFWPAPGTATGASVIVCPGGGYSSLADYEGADYALWLAERGIAGFVLRYRLGSGGYHHPVQLCDAARAVRVVRSRATAWGLDPARIGIMGSSAGGHLAASLATLFEPGKPGAADPVERVGSRPDLAILCYAVISMGALAHEGSRSNLLGGGDSPALRELLSCERQVRPDTPPCFVWHTQDDAVVKVENAMEFAAALQAKGVPFTLHIYPSGAHGLGLGATGWRPGDPRPLHPWTRELEVWLGGRGFARP